MPLERPLVDVEALLVGWLAADAGVLAELGTPAVATELPADFPEAGERFVQVFRVTGTIVDAETGFIERPVVQLNTFGGSKGDAWDVFAACFVAMFAARRGVHVGAVVTQVEKVSGPTWSRDPSTQAPRYVSAWALTLHPTA